MEARAGGRGLVHNIGAQECLDGTKLAALRWLHYYSLLL